MMRRAFLGCVLCVCLPVSAAGAQESPPGVANSGMQQGEAVVAVRSDVRLAIKGIRATLSDRLAAMTREISAQMPAVRACYTKIVATRPATVGGMRAVIVLEPGRGAPSIETTEIDGSDAELSACIGKILRHLDLRGVERPAAAELTLSFDNTRARGQAVLEERAAGFVANVETAPDGNHVGRWHTDGSEITFEVRVAAASGGPELAQSLVLGLRAGFSAFLDCRRRAGRQGMNPSGDVELDVQVARNGDVSGHVARSSVEDQKRTPGCVEKAVGRLRLESVTRAGRASMIVHFAP